MAQQKSADGVSYKGFVDALVKIPQQEGFGALYKVREAPLREREGAVIK